MRWNRLLVGGAISIGCRSEPSDGAHTETDGASEGSMTQAGPVCPSLGLDADAAVLVTSDYERVLIVRADGSTLELDPHPPASRFEHRYAGVGVSTAGIVTTSSWSDESHYLAASMFSLDGTQRWAMQWEGIRNELYAWPMVASNGDAAITVVEGLIAVHGDDVHTYPRLEPLAAPHGGYVPVRTYEEPHPDVARYGWVDLDTRVHTEVPIIGEVEAHEGRIVSRYDGIGHRVQISAPGEALREIRVDADRTLARSHLAGSRMMLTDYPVLELAAHIDLDAATVSIAPLEPPDGFHMLACGWPSLTETGDALFPISDGTAVFLYEMTPGGEWSAAPTLPLSGVPGGYGRRIGDTYSFSSIASSAYCDEGSPERDGTVVGDSLQLVRPDSGVTFVRENLEVHNFVTSTKDGSCVAWRSAPDRLLFIDMITGDEQEIEVPADENGPPHGVDAFVD